MQLGYGETKKRNRDYRKALRYFSQALEIIPENKYAVRAVRNVKGYIRRSKGTIVSFAPGNPNRTNGASTRSVPGQPVINLLTPTYDPEPQLTTSKNPTFFLHMYTGSETKRADLKFVLREGGNRGKIVYEKKEKPDIHEGIISFTLPRDQELKIGQDYTWIVTLTNDDGEGETENGKIRREELPEFLNEQLLKTKDPMEQVHLYVQAELWKMP